MIELRQSTAGQEIPLGYFLDSTDGNTEETGLTIANTDIKLWKFGATTLANKNAGGATHMSNAIFYCVLDATDTDTLGALVIFVHVAGALAVKVECAVLTANVWDSKYSTDKLEVDLLQIGGSEQSQIDLKDFSDDGYDPATNKVQGVVLVDTTTANTDMVGTDNAATAAKLLAYVQLLARSDAAINTDNATELAEINANEGTGVGNFDNQTDAEEALGDVASNLVSASAFATVVVDEWETQSQADPTGFHVNVIEVNGTAQTANDIGDDVNAILIDTGTNLVANQSLIYNRIGADGSALTALPWNAAWNAEVQSEVQDAIEANHLDHLLAVDYDPAAKPGVATALLNELIENDGGVSRYTANALEQAPSGTGGDATEEKQDTIINHLTEVKGAGWVDENLTTIDGLIDTLIARCTELRLAELDAANLPADIDTLLTRITAAVALASVCTETRLAELDAANLPADIATRSSHTAADVWAVGVRTLTSFGTLVADIWDRLTSALTTVGSIGKFLVDTVSEGDATEEKQDIIITHLTEVKGSGFLEATDSNEAIRNRGDAAWGGGLAGSNAITINIKDENTNNVVECAVEIWDQANTTFYERKITNSNGDTLYNIDDGTYTIRIHKAGYTFSDKTLVVTIAETINYTGTTVIIGTPADITACRVYDYAFQSDGLTPVVSIDASCFISSLPYDYSGKIHSGERRDGVYDSETGLLYFDLAKGSTVKFKIKHFGYINKTKVIPDLDQARLTDIED